VFITAKVFSEEASQHFLPKRPWDHTIELKPETPDVIDCKIYPLAQEEEGAFKTKYSLFKLLVMFFGLTNSPSTFQTMMNHIFHDLHIKHLQSSTQIIVYMDDILIATSSRLSNHE